MSDRSATINPVPCAFPDTQGELPSRWPFFPDVHHISKMRYKDFTVTVNSASRSPQGLLKTVALQEYPAKGPYQGNTAYTFIASQACQQFSITVQNDNPKDASVVFYVDGQMASVLLCYAKPKCHIVTCHGVQPQPGVLRRFVFKRATLTGILAI